LTSSASTGSLGKPFLPLATTWIGPTAPTHLRLLQNKLNRYLAFVESGEIFQSYPKAQDRPIVFTVVFKFRPNEEGRAFLDNVRPIVESAGITFLEKVSIGAPFN
jgi:hypothetical protein